MPFTRTILIAASFLPTVVFAQMAHGPRLGIGASTINTTGQFLQWTGVAKFGLIAGYSFDFWLADQVGLMVEPMYAGKGSRVNNTSIKQTTRTTLHYFEVPIVLKISLNKDPQGIFLSVGAIPGYLIKGTESVTQNSEELYKKDIDDENLSRTQFSASLGFGYEKGPFEVELRGENSITPFDAMLNKQNLMVGLHFTYRFRPKPEEEKNEEDYIEGD